MRHTVKQALDGAEYLPLTTNLWTGCYNHGYMSLSVHFVSSDWNMGYYCMQTREVASSHTALNLADELRNSMEEWEITDKVVMVTTDNGHNIRNAITEELELSHLGCIGHTLQLSIGMALQISTVSRILGRVRNLWSIFISLHWLPTVCGRSKFV